ncbi:MAG: inositol monophosphatase family protein [Acidimicrobiales bacterium]
MDTAWLLEVLSEAAERIREALDRLDDWGPAGTRAGQYRSDLVADEAAVGVLISAGLGVLSEESGRTGPAEAELVAVLDPVDGSTNAARGIPWFATSICVVDGTGPVVALVVNQATGCRYEAVRGKGATRDGQEIKPSSETDLTRAVIGLAGYPARHLGWRQYRALGAAALDLCAVADGTLDGYADCGVEGHGVWDYLGGALVCSETGAQLIDAGARDLAVLDHRERRSPVAAGTPELLEALVGARNSA